MKKNILFSKNLRTWLFANDQSQNDLGREIGVTGTAVGRWINDGRIPPGPALKQLCLYIGISEQDMTEKDLTLKIIKDANYTSLLAEPEDETYADSSSLRRAIGQIESIQNELRGILNTTDSFLKSVKSA